MMSTERYKSFSEFYPNYLEEHKRMGTRITHFIGTSIFFVFFAYAFFSSNGYFILLGVISAYLMAWIGHFFIERNKPATFKYPLWSLLGDFKLYFQLLTGKEKF